MFNEPHPPSVPETSTLPEPRPWMSWGLLAANVAVFAAMARAGVFATRVSSASLFAWGADYGPAVFLDGQAWRLLASAFVHSGVAHLALNAWALWVLGPRCERRLGRVRYLAVYGACALAGSLASVVVRPEGVSVGASGALFGLVGVDVACALLAGPPERRAALARVGWYALGSVGLGAAFGNVDHSAHVGGFVMGALLGPGFSGRASGLRQGAVVGLLVVGLGGLGAGARARVMDAPAARADREVRAVYAALQARRPAEALASAERAVAVAPQDARARYARADARLASQRFDDAADDYEAVLALDPGFSKAGGRACHARAWGAFPASAVAPCERASQVANAGNAYVLLALARSYTVAGQYEEAAAAAQRALSLAPGLEGAQLTLAWAWLSANAPERARPALEAAEAASPGSPHVRLARARAAVLERRLDDAERLYRELSRDAPTPELAASLAEVLRARGAAKDALAVYDEALAASPDAAVLHNNRAWALLAWGRAREALASADRAVALAPELAPALGTRCFVRQALGDVAGARDDCNAALALSPGSAVDRGMLQLLDGEPAAVVEATWREDRRLPPEDRAFLDTVLARARRTRRSQE